MAGLSLPHPAPRDSVPSPAALGASLLLSAAKASSSWFFCRLSRWTLRTTCRSHYSLFGNRLGLLPVGRDTMPAADFCGPVRRNLSLLSHDAVTSHRPPEVSSTAFDAQPPDLPPVRLMDMSFAVICPLAPHCRPRYPVLVHRLASLLHASFRPRLATTPLRFAITSPPSGCEEDFHLQAVVHARHTKKSPGLAAGALSIFR